MSGRQLVTVGNDALSVEIVADRTAAGRYRVRVGETWAEVDGRLAESGATSLLVDGVSWLVDDIREDDGDIVVTLGGEPVRVRVDEPGRGPGDRRGRRGGGGQRLVAPMPGRVVAVHVARGDRVQAGAPLVVLEAMKMENEFRATGDGVVAEVAVAAGQAVNAGDLLVVVTPAGS
jgi:biotin carboxyl carrier protein